MPDMTFLNAALISRKAEEICKGRACKGCPLKLEDSGCRMSGNFPTPYTLLDIFMSLTEVKDILEKYEEEQIKEITKKFEADKND